MTTINLTDRQAEALTALLGATTDLTDRGDLDRLYDALLADGHTGDGIEVSMRVNDLHDDNEEGSQPIVLLVMD